MWLKVRPYLAVKHPPASPIRFHNFASFNNISNILRYLYGKPPHNIRKCGWRLSYLLDCDLSGVTFVVALRDLLHSIHYFLLFNTTQLRQFEQIVQYFTMRPTQWPIILTPCPYDPITPKAVAYHTNTVPLWPYHAQGSGLSWTYSNVTYHDCRCMIGHSLGRMGICMDEQTCEAKLPHINRKCGKKSEEIGSIGVYTGGSCRTIA